MDSSSADASPQFEQTDPPPAVDSWHDLIDHLTGELADNGEALECELDDVTLDVPMRMHPDADTARWKFDGDVTVSLGEVRVPLREWREYWDNAE
jgi:hypothetical protein